jgi:hypothetical protein
LIGVTVASKTVERRLKRLVHAYSPVARLLYRGRFGQFGPFLADTFVIPSWLGRYEGLAIAEASYALPDNAVVVEIGSSLGTSSIMLAGGRKRRGSGRVHCRSVRRVRRRIFGPLLPRDC